MANQNTPLVILAKDKDQNKIPVTTSKIIADALNKQHCDVIKLVRKYKNDFSEFGELHFKKIEHHYADSKTDIKPQNIFKNQNYRFKTQDKSGRTTEIAILNEQQATLLITYMRNNEEVRQFKVALVKAFYDMRESLAKTQQPLLDRPKYLPPSTNKIERTSDVIEYDLTTLKKAKESLQWWNEHRDDAQDMCFRLNYALDVLKEEQRKAWQLLDQFASILDISSHTGETELGRIIAQLEIIDKKRESIPNHIKKAVY